MPTKSPYTEVVSAALARVLRRGLPVTAAEADSVLLGLDGVTVRATDPDDAESRVAALDGLLRVLLARFPDTRYAEAARALFGLPPAEPGLNLTARRELAARLAGHEGHHFRKRVEPRLVQRLAALALVDATRYLRSRRSPPRMVGHVPGRRPIPSDPFAWELAEHEEALCRLWSAIYALRAELLAVQRLTSMGSDQQRLVHQAVAAAWRWGQASAEAAAYTTAFSAGDPPEETPPTNLLPMAGWTPPLTGEQQARLRGAASGASREEFTAALHADADLTRAWVDALIGSQAETRTRATERLIS